MKKLSRYLLLPLLSIAIIFAGLLVFAKPAIASSQQFASDVACEWIDGHQVKCERTDLAGDLFSSLAGLIDAVSFSPQDVWGGAPPTNVADLSQAIASAVGTNCTANTCDDLVYDPRASEANGYPTFCDGNSSIRNMVCLHFATNNPMVAFARTDSNKITNSSSISADNTFPVGGVENVEATFGDECSVPNPGSCKISSWLGGGDFTGAGLDTSGFLETAAAIAAEQSDDCNGLDTPLSFFLCPVHKFIVNTYTFMLEGLEGALENPDITGNANMKTIINSFITLANSFYILIFLIIIIGNFIAIPALDNYTIKKTLPKLFWAVIFTQFSLLICQAVLDLGNILAVSIPTFILTAFPATAGKTPVEAFIVAVDPTSVIGTNYGAGYGLAKFALTGITLIVGIIAILIALIYLVARYLFLFLIVIFAPVAFAAWVLPNTEKFFKKWWEYFIRLSIMFLLVNLLLAAGAVFTFVLAGGGFGGITQNFFAKLVALFVPIIVLFMIPKTVKASNQVMKAAKEASSKALASAKESRAGKAISKSGQEGKLAEAKGGAMEKFGRSNLGKAMGKNRAAMMEAKGAQKKDVVKTKVKDAVSKLSFDRQLELRDQGGDVGEAAKETIGEKQGKLENQSVLNKGDLTKLEKLYRIPNPTTDPDEKKAHPFIVTNPELVRARTAIGGETFDDKGLGTVVNPFKPIPGAPVVTGIPGGTGGPGGAGGAGGTGGSGAPGPPGSPGAPPLGGIPGPTGTPPPGGRPTPGGTGGTPTPPSPPPPSVPPTRPTPPPPTTPPAPPGP